MQRPVEKAKIKGLECKHATYVKANDGSQDDILVIKENIHTTDGDVVPNVHIIKNYKRNFWLTKEGHQRYTQKKEWEDINKLQRFSSTQGRLLENIAKAMGRPGMRGGLRTFGRNPYLYGADITTPTLLKHQYQQRFPNAISDNTVAVIDIETDVVEGHGRPIYVSITFRDKVFIATTKEFIKGISNPIEKLHRVAKEQLGEIIKERNITIEAMVAEDAGQACYEAIQRAHQWQPDFLTAWNKNFDIPRIVEALENHGYNLAETFSDPKIPPRFQKFYYKEGESQKVTASGAITPVHPADRWHVTQCPASFFVIDSMCLYKRIRLAAQNEPSYSLDFQLNKHLGMRKLKFDDLVEEEDGTLAWHEVMQQHHKIEYGVYNIFDCVGVELFDEKVRDLAQTISIQAGVSDYGIFHQQPKRLVDQLYFFCLDRDRVVATCSDDMTDYTVKKDPETGLETKDDLDSYTYSMTDWIITLPSHLTVGNGLNVIQEMPEIKSLARANVADLDVSGAYPNGQLILNMSKETTFRELCKVKGVEEHDQRMNGINLTASHVNAYEFCATMLKAPKFDELLEDFIKEGT